jgi:hypothetical protein
MNLPALPSFRAEAFPGAPAWLGQLLQLLNQALRPLQLALSRVPERGEAPDRNFITDASGKATVNLKVSMDKVRNVWVSVRLPSGELLEDVWSYSWRPTSTGQVQLRFVGLAASTKHVFSAVYD